MKTTLLYSMLLLFLLPTLVRAQAVIPKEVALGKALKAFKVGSTVNGLHQLRYVLSLDPKDESARQIYRLHCNRYALETAEGCDMEPGMSNCDSALKYAEESRKYGDSSVFHEIKAMAMYNKVRELETQDFNLYRDNMPERIGKPEACYRYLPEERKAFYRDLIYRTIGEIRISRGDLEKREKIAQLNSRMKVIDRSREMVGME
jgi:hypothetical protein